MEPAEWTGFQAPFLPLVGYLYAQLQAGALVSSFALGHGKFVSSEMLIWLLGMSLEFREAERLQV